MGNALAEHSPYTIHTYKLTEGGIGKVVPTDGSHLQNLSSGGATQDEIDTMKPSILVDWIRKGVFDMLQLQNIFFRNPGR